MHHIYTYIYTHIKILTPLETSQFNISLALCPASSEPSRTNPKPPFITSPLKNQYQVNN